MPPLAGTSALPPASDLKATWNFLEEGIEIMMQKNTDGIEYPRYMNLYTVAYNYCISSRMNTATDRTNGAGAGKAGADLEGVGLYNHLKKYLQDRCTAIEEVCILVWLSYCLSCTDHEITHSSFHPGIKITISRSFTQVLC